MKTFSRIFTTAGVLSCGLFLAQTASASVMGSLFLGNGSTDQVTVGSTSLHWVGTATVSSISTLTYDAGSLLNSGTATLQDLPGAFGSLNFITFSTAPDVHFSLTGIGPGDPVCSSAQTTNCSAFANSPLVLVATPTGTQVSLSVTGQAYDSTNVVSSYVGLFTTTVTSLSGYSGVITPLEIQAFFGGPNAPNAATITSTYASSFAVTLTPEPSSIAMMAMGTGGILFAMIRRRKQSR